MMPSRRLNARWQDKLRAPLTLTIDLNALAFNYRLIQARVGPGVDVAGVVKANGYGLGVAPVIQTLLSAECPFFYVANLAEAITARAVTDGMITSFAGFWSRDQLADYRAHKMTPVINTPEQIDWVLADAPDLPVVLQLDTGMHRLGLSGAQVEKLCAAPDKLRALNIHHALSHFACSDEKDHAMNAAQAGEFSDLVQKINLAVGKRIRASLANSSGIFRDASYHHDIVRPGFALYGGNPMPEGKNPMQSVVRLDARILQIRDAMGPGKTVGYGATFAATRPTKIATIGAGYADGLCRALSNRGRVFWQGVACPIIGRVSMDLITVDITDLPAHVPPPHLGDQMEIIGPHQSVDDLAAAAGTIGYEILTQLSSRAERVYTPLNKT